MDSPYGISSIWQQGDSAIRIVAVILLCMSIASWLVIVLRTWDLIRLRKPSRALADFWH